MTQEALFMTEADRDLGALVIKVRGRPAPQGSKSAFPLWARFVDGDEKGRCRRCKQRRFVRVNQVEKSEYVKPWRDAVQAAARLAWRRPPITGALACSMVFTVERPKTTHYRQGKFSHLLRDDAPPYPSGGGQLGDLSKLLRATEDALNGVVWKDDCQVVLYRRLGVFWAGEDPDGEGLPYPGVVIKLWKLR